MSEQQGRDWLTEACRENAEAVVAAWWQLADQLIDFLRTRGRLDGEDGPN